MHGTCSQNHVLPNWRVNIGIGNFSFGCACGSTYAEDARYLLSESRSSELEGKHGGCACGSTYAQDAGYLLSELRSLELEGKHGCKAIFILAVLGLRLMPSMCGTCGQSHVPRNWRVRLGARNLAS